MRHTGIVEHKFECRICLSASSDSAIRMTLEKALPSFQWEEGDSAWDKIRVWGKSPDASVRVYRYEGPGPFELTITIQAPVGRPAEEAYLALRVKVLQALEGTLWKPLEPQSVSYVKVQGRFPAAYQFDCDLSLAMIQNRLEDADFWHFETRRHGTFGISIEGRIPFRLVGNPKWNYNERIRITGEQPTYTIEVGIWRDEPDRTPTCDQVHELVQNTILPAIGARMLQPKP